MICQRHDTNNEISTNNDIHDNNAASYYGIQLIGNDEEKPYWVPRSNRIANNNLSGSVNACIDDFNPAQWSTGANTWVGCTPAFF
ncbi:MAG: hypothetical protein KC416_07690 [Myxococcales bacterium]|nr:hypothetical protein [Myxococcales bacterium]